MDRAGRETILDTTYKCAQYLMPRFIGEQEEGVYLLCLDAKCKALDCSLIHRGAVNMTAISVRKIVKAALDPFAIVKVLPEPVTPSRTCSSSPILTPFTSFSMACG